MIHLTLEERALGKAGLAIIGHCQLCGHEIFVCRLPARIDAAVEQIKSRRCPNDPTHTLYMGFNERQSP
jgi:hypothetical protein